MAKQEPRQYRLTPRLEALVTHFDEILRNMPDDLLYDELTTEHPSTLPDRWNTDGAPGSSP